jgi:hypothetical protein
MIALRHSINQISGQAPALEAAKVANSLGPATDALGPATDAFPTEGQAG